MALNPDKQSVRSGVLQHIANALAHYGLNPETTLAEMGLSIELFHDGDNMMQIMDLVHLLEHCVEKTGDEHFSLFLARMQDLTFLGDLGLLMQTAPTLGDALMEMPKYLHIHMQPANWTFRLQDELVVLEFTIDVTELSSRQRRICTELGFGQVYKTLQLLTHGKMRLESISFQMPPRDNQTVYRRYFRAPVHYNKETDCIILNSKNLRMAVIHSNAKLHSLVRKEIKLSKQYRQGKILPQEINNIIRTLLPNGQCNIEAVASKIGCDKRTLQRHLRENFDTTFQTLLNEVKFSQACLYLKETNMSITQLAYVLGFTDVGNFSRAFRRQFDQSPKRWRSTNQNKNVRQSRLLPHTRLF